MVHQGRWVAGVVHQGEDGGDGVGKVIEGLGSWGTFQGRHIKVGTSR